MYSTFQNGFNKVMYNKQIKNNFKLLTRSLRGNSKRLYFLTYCNFNFATYNITTVTKTKS